MTEHKKNTDLGPATTDHLCIPCDVETMARRLNLDKRRVQQLAKEHPRTKNDRGEYVCPVFVTIYSAMLQSPKRSRASGLTKKQEESLEIRNARDRADVLAEWETMVLQQAIVRELAPMVIALKNGLRELPSVLARQVVLFAKEYAESVRDNAPVAEHELFARAQKMLAEPQDEKLKTFEKEITVWADKCGDIKQTNSEMNRREAT